MPGGPKEGYERVRPILEAAAAKVNGDPCVTWLGPGSAADFVKMVHNGIEYWVMQLIAETYDLMKNDATLVMCDDQVEAAWRLLMPMLEVWAVAPPSDFPNYATGTWGPGDAQGLLAQGYRGMAWPNGHWVAFLRTSFSCALEAGGRRQPQLPPHQPRSGH